MILQKYENFIQNLNYQILNWNFDIKKNSKTLEIIIEIYKELKLKNYKKVKNLIYNLWLENDKTKKKSNLRDWYFEDNTQEENIEAFNSIEMMSAIFLQNIKEKIWTEK